MNRLLTFALVLASSCGSVSSNDLGEQASELAPYAEPGEEWDRYMNRCGTHETPYCISPAYQFAIAEHRDTWAAKDLGTLCEYGQFSQPVQLLGRTFYSWVSREQLHISWCTEICPTTCAP